MSYTHAYLVKCFCNNGEICALVNSGNTRGALNKFMLHISEYSDKLYTQAKFLHHVDHTFTRSCSHGEAANAVYTNKDGSVRFYIKKINVGDDFTFITANEDVFPSDTKD